MDKSPETEVPLFGAVMTTLGLSLLDFDCGPYIPARILVRISEQLGFKAPAVRAMLRRSSERGLLREKREGREVHYGLTVSGAALVEQGQRRVYDTGALAHESGEWTILAFPDPQVIRNDRYQVTTRLAFAGFAQLMPNVWITPGRRDAEILMRDVFDVHSGEEFPSDVMAFVANPLSDSRVRRMVERTWDTEAIRAQYARFLAVWSAPRFDPTNPLADLIRLINGWADLLLVDPGLPAVGPEDDWPAERARQIFTHTKDALWESARSQLNDWIKQNT